MWGCWVEGYEEGRGNSWEMSLLGSVIQRQVALTEGTEYFCQANAGCCHDGALPARGSRVDQRGVDEM